MSNHPCNEFRLDLGGCVIAFHCDPAPFSGFLSYWFDRPTTLKDPHIHLEMELVPHRESLKLPNTLLQTKTVDGKGGFDIDNGLIRGYYDPTTRRGKIEAKAVLAQGELMRVMEQIFYQAFFSARQAAGLDSILVHSSAAIADGQGFLFVGPSEAGKSTAILNSSAHHVLGDEMNLIHFTEEGLVLEGSPFNGLFRDKKPGKAPLRAVFLLNQASRHSIEEIGSAEAGSILAAEIVPMVSLDEVPGVNTVPDMVEVAAKVIGQTSVKRLNLLPDPGFWSVIAKKYNLALN